jgi:hypothetical protein
MANLLATWQALKAQADQADGEVLERLARAYAAGYSRLDPLVLSLTEQIEALTASGKLTPDAIKKSAAYRNLIRAMIDELDDYSAYMRTEISVAVTESANAGKLAGNTLLLAAIAGSLGVEVTDLPKETILRSNDRTLEFLAKYLDKGGPLFAKINALSNYHAEQISQKILEMVGQGMNPQVIGRWITDAYGMPLTDSLRMMRTAQLYSYRQASAATQLDNADVLQGGVWCAELDDRVCMSCVALHGTEWPVGAIADDHHNGRCAILPWVKGEPNPIEQTGADWFREQDEATQKSMMGEGKYQAWQDGKFELDKLSRKYEDEVFGIMRGETPLKDLLSD